MKRIHILFVFLLGLSSMAHAQVKIGSNPTTITANKNLEVEATDGKKVSVNKSNGVTYIENMPAALATDSVVMRFANGEIRQMSIERVLGQLDTDGDGIKDFNDPDIDGDGVLNAADSCPLVYGCNANGCPAGCTPAVAACATPSTPVVSPATPTISAGGTETFTMANGTPNTSIAWSISPSAGVSPSATGTTSSTGAITFATAGTYTVSFTATNSPGGCTATSSAPGTATITVTEPNGVIAGNATCTGATISVSGCAGVSGATLNDDAGTTDGIEYDWSGGTGYLAENTTTRALVEIGGQCWYRINADKDPTDTTATFTANTDTGWYSYYGNIAPSSYPNSGYGLLYQWSAAMDGSTTERTQGICATGFHVPSDCEWMYLENTLGMSTADQQDWSVRSDAPGTGSSQGTYLSEDTYGYVGKNKSGFTAVMAGNARRGSVQYTARTTAAYFWTSTPKTSGTFDISRYMGTSNSGVNRIGTSKGFGYSVRCLKD